MNAYLSHVVVLGGGRGQGVGGVLGAALDAAVAEHLPLFVGLVEEEGLHHQHPGHTHQGQQHQQDLEAVLAIVHVGGAAALALLVALEQHHVDEGDEHGRGTTRGELQGHVSA